MGSKNVTFGLNESTLGGITLGVDVQLAAIGLVNKIMDMFVQASLRHAASICLTIWMAMGSSKYKGASLLDFELRDELTKPWTCIQNFHKRRLLHGWRGLGPVGIFRFIASLLISSCVLFLALAVNTVGIPKERWYPDVRLSGYQLADGIRDLMTITTVRMELQSLDWGSSWDEAWDMVGSGPVSWDATAALVAASSYTIMSGITDPYKDAIPGWNHVSKEIEGYTTGVNTDVGDGTVQTVSAQHARIMDIYKDFRANSSQSFKRDSMGWNAFLSITIPMLTTDCTSQATDSTPSESSVTVSIPLLPRPPVSLPCDRLKARTI